MDFKNFIKQRRIELNMTMEELGKLIGVSTPTIQRYESGEIKNVRRDKIKLLADALKVSPAKLMGWDDKEDTVSNIINKKLEETGMTLEEVAKKSGVSLHWLQRIDTFTPGEFGSDEIGYSWITRVAETLDLPGSKLRAALARQEIPVYEGQALTAQEAFKQAQEDFKEPINEYGIKTFISEKEQEHLHKYRYVDDKGKHTVDTVLEMEYIRCKSAGESKITDIKMEEDKHIPKAAHERTDIDVTNEMRKHDDDLMDNDDLWK